MGRLLSLTSAFACAASVLLVPALAAASDHRSLPMQFDLRRQGPAEDCGSACRILISASGVITSDTPREFLKFARGRDLTGALVVLDSDGGSVRGAIALGREMRRLSLDATVGRVVDLKPSGPGERRATLAPQADCESMCAFVLLAGIHRSVPPQARVMVHQIWLGDRRDDPTAANYSAEDMVLVQRDIGQLARYIAEMGGSMDMLDLALRIPPWERMHAMTRDEIVRMRVATGERDAITTATVASAPAVLEPPVVPPDVTLATEISERRWVMIDRSGTTFLARRHPLTVDGEDIGTFDLLVSCGAARDTYLVSYIERRRGTSETPLPVMLGAVSVLAAGRGEASLKVLSSQRSGRPNELVSTAAGPVPAALIDGFANTGNHSLTVETQSEGIVTGIRLGNTGVRQLLPRLVAGCRKPRGERAQLDVRKGG